MASSEGNRDLLLVLAALQAGVLTQESLVDALHTWVNDKTSSLLQALLRHRALAPEALPPLEERARQYLAAHENNLDRALAAFAPLDSVLQELFQLADPELQTRLTQATALQTPSCTAPESPRPTRTTSPTSPRFRVLRPLPGSPLLLGQDEELHREVMLKELPANPGADVQQHEALRQEACLTAALEHPGIVPVYGLGEHADGRPFYAMRLVQGESLAQALQPNAGLRPLLRRFLDVCNAVAYAHSRGVVHGGLEPAKVILGRYAETVIVNWDSAERTDSRLRPRVSPGSPSPLYAGERGWGEGAGVRRQNPLTLDPSPPEYRGRGEQCGQAPSGPEHGEPLGPAADVYHLGAMLHAILSGQARGSPPALAAVCRKAMARRPEDRYPSVRALAEDVESWLADGPVSVYREGWLTRLARWGRRHKPLVSGAAVLLVTAGLVLAASAAVIARAGRNEAYQKGRAEELRGQADDRAEVERQAKAHARAAEEETLRQSLVIAHRSAESDLSAARLLRSAGGESRRQTAALDLLGKAAALAGESEATVRRLGDAAGELRGTEPRTWGQRRIALRDEATHWLTQLALGRGEPIRLPVQPRVLRLPPDVAVSPDGSQLALAVDGAEGVTCIQVPGEIQRFLPLPDGMSRFRQTTFFNALRFPTPRSIELLTHDQLVSWTLPEGKPQARPLTAEEKAAHRRQTAQRGKARAEVLLGTRAPGLPVQSGDRTATVEAGGGVDRWRWQVRLDSGPGGRRARIVWRTTDHRATPRWLQFSPDGRFLFLLTAIQRLVLVDLQSGLQTEEPLPVGVEGIELLPYANGIATVERAGRLALSGSQVTLWTLVRPRVWQAGLPHPLSARCLDVADDGLTVTGGEDHVVRLWRKGQPLWSAGLSWDRPLGRGRWGPFPPWWNLGPAHPDTTRVNDRTNTTSREAYSDLGFLRFSLEDREIIELPATGPPSGPGGAMPWLRRHAVYVGQQEEWRYTLDVASLVLVGGSNQVVRLVKAQHRAWPWAMPREKPYRPFAADALYPWWGFAVAPGAGAEKGEHAFVLKRRQPAADGNFEIITEVYAAETGKPSRTLPAAGVGRIVAESRDHRSAIVVAEEPMRKWTLDVLSLEEDRVRGRLGTYPTQPSVPAAYFSHSGRWLVIVSGADVEVWQLPALHRTATVHLPGPRIRCEFDPDERRLLLVGPSYAGDLPPVGQAFDPPFGQVIELESGKKLCDLQDLRDLGCFADSTFRFTREQVLCVCHGDLASVPVEVVLWDLKTGARTRLREPVGGKVDPGDWALRGGLVDLSPDGKRLVVASSWQDEKSRLVRTYLQLWDLPGKRVLRQHHVRHEGGDVRYRWYLRLVPDKIGFYVTLGDEADDKGSIYHGWRWEDGQHYQSRPLKLLAVDEDLHWTLWRDAKHVFLYHRGVNRSFALQDSASYDYRASSPSGRFVVLEKAKSSGLWDVVTGKRLVAFPKGHRFGAFDPTGAWVATVDPVAEEVRVWQVRSGREAHRFQVPALADNNGKPRLTTYHSTREGKVHTVRLEPIEVRVHPRGDRIAVLVHGVIRLFGPIRIGEATGSQLLQTIPVPGPYDPVECVAQHAGARLVASGGAEGAVLLWDRKEGHLLRPLLGHADAITALAFASDGTWLASAGADGRVIVRQPDGKRRWIYQVPKPVAGVRCLVLQPGTALLAAGTDDGRVLLLDVGRQEVRGTVKTDGSAVQCLAFARSGKLLAAGTAAGHVYCWQPTVLKQPRRLTSDAAVTALAFVHGEDLLASGGRAIRFWDVPTGRGLLTLEAAHGPVRSLGLDRSNEALLIADGDDNVRLLDLPALQRELNRLRLALPALPAP